MHLQPYLNHQWLLIRAPPDTTYHLNTMDVPKSNRMEDISPNQFSRALVQQTADSDIHCTNSPPAVGNLGPYSDRNSVQELIYAMSNLTNRLVSTDKLLSTNNFVYLEIHLLITTVITLVIQS